MEEKKAKRLTYRDIQFKHYQTYAKEAEGLKRTRKGLNAAIKCAKANEFKDSGVDDYISSCDQSKSKKRRNSNSDAEAKGSANEKGAGAEC